jgi:hypothetical protein
VDSTSHRSGFSNVSHCTYTKLMQSSYHNSLRERIAIVRHHVSYGSPQGRESEKRNVEHHSGLQMPPIVRKYLVLLHVRRTVILYQTRMQNVITRWQETRQRASYVAWPLMSELIHAAFCTGIRIQRPSRQGAGFYPAAVAESLVN